MYENHQVKNIQLQRYAVGLGTGKNPIQVIFLPPKFYFFRVLLHLHVHLKLINSLCYLFVASHITKTLIFIEIYFLDKG